MSARTLRRLVVCVMLVCLHGCAKRQPAQPERELDKQFSSAAASGDVQEMKRLLSLGADINCRDRSLAGWTPLIWALYEDHDDAALALLAAGADPNIEDGTRKTALFYAAARHGDHSAVITALIRAGASTEPYRALFEGLPPDDPNRIAFEGTTNARPKEAGSVLDKRE